MDEKGSQNARDADAGLLLGTNDGDSWEHITEGIGQGYTVGMHINPDRAGEILIATGQRPPGLAARVYHSVDGGHIWEPVLDPVLPELYERVPVVFFAQGGAWIATEKGQVFRTDAGKRNGDPDPKGNLGSWSLVHELPAPVKVASAGGSPSSISSGFADWF